jgi:hypothetical protein
METPRSGNPLLDFIVETGLYGAILFAHLALVLYLVREAAKELIRLRRRIEATTTISTTTYELVAVTLRYWITSSKGITEAQAESLLERLEGVEENMRRLDRHHSIGTPPSWTPAPPRQDPTEPSSG